MAIDLSSAAVNTMLATAETAMQAGDYTAAITALQSAYSEQQSHLQALGAAGEDEKNRLKEIKDGGLAISALSKLFP